MSNLALVFSDLQAGEGSDSERLRANPAIPLQRWRVEQFYADLKTLYDRHGCKYLIDLGDTTDDRKSLPVPTIGAIMSGLNAIRPDPKLSIKLIGNHEQAYRAGNFHPGLIYQAFHHVVPEEEVIFAGETAIVCVSYPNEEGRTSLWLYETLRRLKENYSYTKILVLGHLGVEGSVSSGRSLPGAFAPYMFQHATLALLGHVHQPQQMADNLYYVGSPFQQDFGEANQAKRVCLLDLDTLEFEWLSLPSPYPRYLRLSVDELECYGSLGEDRVQVVLRTTAEAERYHASPLAALVEPDYQLAPSSSATSLSKVQLNTDWLGGWVDAKPLEGFTREEILAAGKEITGL